MIFEYLDLNLKKYFNYGKNLEDDEIDIGREFQKSITTGVTYSTKGVAEIFTTITDAIGDTNFTKDLDRLTEDFLEHQKPETWQGDVTRLVTQYGLPSTWVSKLLTKLPKLHKLKKNQKIT